MTDNERAEYEVLKLANENGKFAIGVGLRIPEEQQLALERLQLRYWVSLIDLVPLMRSPNHTQPVLCRIFLASPEALTWFRRQQ